MSNDMVDNIPATDKPSPLRLALTKRQLAESQGAELLNLLVDFTGDGKIGNDEIVKLRRWLATTTSSYPSIMLLKDTVERVVADGVVTPDERAELHGLIERILPVTERGMAKEARKEIENERKAEEREANRERREEERRNRWRSDPATERQEQYIRVLGGVMPVGATKGEASELIDSLKGNHAKEVMFSRPVSPRQWMVLRFWGKEPPDQASRLDVSEWMDAWYDEDPDRVTAWELFKEENPGIDAACDPKRIKRGIGLTYLQRAKATLAAPVLDPSPVVDDRPAANRRRLNPVVRIRIRLSGFTAAKRLQHRARTFPVYASKGWRESQVSGGEEGKAQWMYLEMTEREYQNAYSFWSRFWFRLRRSVTFET